MDTSVTKSSQCYHSFLDRKHYPNTPISHDYKFLHPSHISELGSRGYSFTCTRHSTGPSCTVHSGAMLLQLTFSVY